MTEKIATITIDISIDQNKEKEPKPEHSFQEVMKQFDRMCWYYQRNNECPMGCPMNGVNISQCRKIAFTEPKTTEKTVMDWAADHEDNRYE